MYYLFLSVLGSKLDDGKGLQGKGRLTIEKIYSFQTYYGKAIRGNKGDMSKMKSGTQAILHHSSDLPEDIGHQYCPEGPDSWCKAKKRER